MLALAALAVGAEEPASEIAPPRLSFVDGTASFWRPGAEDWAPTRINTPLAAGDALYTGERANLEVQIGPRAFLRAAEKTQLGIVNLEPDFVQVKVTAGHASLDLRSLAAGDTVELDTPGAAFTIEHPGYYRVAVLDDVVHFITRGGGRATISVAGGPPRAISPSEEIVVRGVAAPSVETYVAPELDAWDRWNYARTDHELEALSARYVAPGIYGLSELDHWGAWRVVPAYGPVWIPERAPPGWAPYTAGSWMWDPRYAWTWVDDAPWGWAPFHYGRWVFIDGLWAWAPGPVILRPVYAPALVAFFAIAPGVSVRIGIPGPSVGWVALGWGEPLRPWWGRPGFAGVPSWRGWGGPRVAAEVHEHMKTPRAAIAVSHDRFGAGAVRGTRFSPAPKDVQRIGEAHPVRPRPRSHVPRPGPAIRAPAAVASRPVVATRPPREPTKAPAPRIVVAPKRPDASVAPPRPSFGTPAVERRRPAQPPRLEDLRKADKSGKGEKAPPRRLPGRPANGLFPRPAAR